MRVGSDGSDAAKANVTNKKKGKENGEAHDNWTSMRDIHAEGPTFFFFVVSFTAILCSSLVPSDNHEIIPIG